MISLLSDLTSISLFHALACTWYLMYLDKLKHMYYISAYIYWLSIAWLAVSLCVKVVRLTCLFLGNKHFFVQHFGLPADQLTDTYAYAIYLQSTAFCYHNIFTMNLCNTWFLLFKFALSEILISIAHNLIPSKYIAFH